MQLSLYYTNFISANGRVTALPFTPSARALPPPCSLRGPSDPRNLWEPVFIRFHGLGLAQPRSGACGTGPQAPGWGEQPPRLAWD